MTKSAVFIFARGGSKGLPGKNIRKLLGKPLIGWAIEQALAVNGIERVCVSTDCEEIANISLAFGADVPFLRPPELARDDTPEWLAWRHALDYLKKREGSMPDVLVSVPPTAPLRLASDIEACLEEFSRGGCEAVITTTAARRNPYFNMVKFNLNGTVGLVIPPSDTVARRQDAPTVYDIATVAYVLDAHFVMERSALFDGRVRSVCVPVERAIDIDDLIDFHIAERLLELRGMGIFE